MTARVNWWAAAMVEPKLLILGGTTLAAQLAGAVSARGMAATYSLAGRTTAKPIAGVTIRQGSFGGADALAAFIRAEGMTAVIDATHAFAPQISLNAETACRMAGRPLLRLQAPPWQAAAGDHWRDVPDITAARDVAAAMASRVFVTTGRQTMAQFSQDSRCWWLARVITPGDDLPVLANGRYLFARGPFDVAGEVALLQEHDIAAIITKNAGSQATYAKVLAARQCALPVVMIARPPQGEAPLATSVEAALKWLDTL